MILRRTHPSDKLIVVSRQITVQNELGLHARPAAEFVRGVDSSGAILLDGDGLLECPHLHVNQQTGVRDEMGSNRGNPHESGE